MVKYVARRLLGTVVTLLGVSIITFLLIFAGPTDPARALAGPKAMAASIELTRQKYGLDKPIPVQYIRYMGRLLQGDLGDSYYFRRPVAEAIWEKFPSTVLLALSIMAVAVLIGIPMGAIAALYNNSIVDRGFMITELLMMSVPTFFFGLLLIYVFAFKLGWFPVGGHGTLGHLVLPTLSVALPWSGWYGIFLRSSMLEVISADYVRTAHAKGLNRWTVAWRHMLRNAILPVITMIGMDLASLLTGIALVEYIFNWPGIGWQTLQGARHSDVPLIMGSILFAALLIGITNLVVDIFYTLLDPRVRLE